MLRSGPRGSLTGVALAARDAWSQQHARDPRSKQLTAAEKTGQQTLLAWARTNTPDALSRSTAQRGRPEGYKLHFGGTAKWEGWTLRQMLTLATKTKTVQEQVMATINAKVPGAAGAAGAAGGRAPREARRAGAAGGGASTASLATVPPTTFTPTAAVKHASGRHLYTIS